MAKHRAATPKRGRTVVGRVLAGAALGLTAPSGMAFAAEHPVSTPGDTVARPGFDNPAPLVRAAQTIGDNIFHGGGPLSAPVNASPLGAAYKAAFGEPGTITTVDGVNYYQEGTGSNGYIKGALNAPIGTVVGGVIPLRECNILRDNVTGVPKGLQGHNAGCTK
jgi:hypothetical protein